MALTAAHHLPPTSFPSFPHAPAATVGIGIAPSSPSPTSSPSHDFTFTIPLDPPPPPLPSSSSSPLPSPRSTAPSRTQAAGTGGIGEGGEGTTIDLAPADDIFFHGHLLPLRILTRPPPSPRRSTDNHRQLRPTASSSNTPTTGAGAGVQRNGSTSSTATDRSVDDARGVKDAKSKGNKAAKPKSKSKQFALSLFAAFWRRDAHNPNGAKSHDSDGEGDHDLDDDSAAAKRKRRHYLDDVGRALRKYAAAAVEALLFPRGGSSSADERRRAGQRDLRRQAHSFSSGYLSSRKPRERAERTAGSSTSLSFKRKKGHWGELASAPASMRTSPNNSGLLVAGPPKASAESSMEELQNAIQAAIAHCKSSIAVKDTDKDDSANDSGSNNHSIHSNGNSDHTCKSS